MRSMTISQDLASRVSDAERRTAFTTGLEHVVDAHGCREAALRSRPTLERLCAAIISDLGLRIVAEPQWHIFPGPGGVTGLFLLAESHLSVHTFPEHHYAALNLYCCRSSQEWQWREALEQMLGAQRVTVRTLTRGT